MSYLDQTQLIYNKAGTSKKQKTKKEHQNETKKYIFCIIFFEKYIVIDWKGARWNTKYREFC